MSTSACTYNLTYTLGCKDNVGGNETLVIRSFSASTVWSEDADGLITGATNSTSPFYSIEARQEQIEFNSEGTHSDTNGTNFWTPSVTFFLEKYQATVRNLVYALAINNSDVIVTDNNGKYFLIENAYITASPTGTGKAWADPNGSTITLQSRSKTPPREVGATFYATLTIN